MIRLTLFFIIFAGVLIFVFVRSSSITARLTGILYSGSASFESYADRIFTECSSIRSSSGRRACYELEVPKLVGAISVRGAFEVTELIQKKDPTYLWCHNMGHQISEREYAKDPSRWKEVITQCPVGACSNGCIHGAMQAHFREASLGGVELKEVMPDLQSLCEERDDWHPTGLEQASCYHELGHLSVYLTGADINEAVGVCDTIGIKDDGRNFLQTCKEGIFMQIFEPREPEDFALVYDLIPSKEKLESCEQFIGEAKGACWEKGWNGSAESFCNQFSGPERAACFNEAWVVQDKDKLATPEGIINYCMFAENQDQKKICYNKLVFSLMALFEFDEERMKKVCVGLPEEVKGACFAHTASRMVETDKDLISRAVEICKFAEEFNLGERCYNELLYYSTFSLHAGSEEFIQYCRHLPDPWNTKCLTTN